MMTTNINDEPQDTTIPGCSINPSVDDIRLQSQPSPFPSSYRSLNQFMPRRLADDISVTTDHSQATLQITNRHIPDDATLQTTASMVTAPIVNTMAATEQQSSSSSSANINNIAISSNGITTTAHQSSQWPMRLHPLACMDSQGRTVTCQELQQFRKLAGKCQQCGITVTHQKRRYGPFGLCRSMVPVTVEGYSYKGCCLYCIPLHEIRRILREPNLSLTMVLPERNFPLTVLNSLPSAESEEINFHQKQSPMKLVFSSLCFQIMLAITIVTLSVVLILIGITRAKMPEPWVSQPPSTAPSSSPSKPIMQWKFSAEIKSHHASFGYRVKLSSDGTILAVSSPKFEEERGRVDVYKLKSTSGQKTWYHIDPLLGTKDSGTDVGDFMSFGMALSGDGLTLAVGSPGKQNGLVDTYKINPNTMTLTAKGNQLEGLMPQCQFGYSVALNSDGTRLFVGAPNDGMIETERYGFVRAYDYNYTTDSWTQIGSIMIGDHIGSRFGHSVASADDGNRIVIGAPRHSSRFENAGKVHYYMLDPQVQLWYQYPKIVPMGETVDAQLGSRVATTANGKMSVSSAKDDPDMALHSNFGIVYAHFYDSILNIVDYLAYPLSGTLQNSSFGYDVDISNLGDILLVSEQNTPSTAGTVRAYHNNVIFIQEGEIVGPTLGLCDSLGNGPSVSLASVEKATMAIGYECLLSNGLSTSEVRIYDYYYFVDE